MAKQGSYKPLTPKQKEQRKTKRDKAKLKRKKYEEGTANKIKKQDTYQGIDLKGKTKLGKSKAELKKALKKNKNFNELSDFQKTKVLNKLYGALKDRVKANKEEKKKKSLEKLLKSKADKKEKAKRSIVSKKQVEKVAKKKLTKEQWAKLTKEWKKTKSTKKQKAKETKKLTKEQWKKLTAKWKKTVGSKKKVGKPIAKKMAGIKVRAKPLTAPKQKNKLTKARPAKQKKEDKRQYNRGRWRRRKDYEQPIDRTKRRKFRPRKKSILN